MDSGVRKRLKDAVGSKLKALIPACSEPRYLAILGYDEVDDFFYGYMLDPDTWDTRGRFGSKLDTIESFSLIEQLSEDELDWEGGLTRKRRIEAYCKERGIFVPEGFDRFGVSTYAIIRNDGNPPHLVAKTWFEQQHVIDYIHGSLTGEFDVSLTEVIDIIDIHARCRLRYHESEGLELVETLNLEPDYPQI